MTAQRVALLTLLSIGLWAAPRARAQELGGGPAASDCYLTFEGITETAPRTVACFDGSSCDADGTVNGSCTFPVSVCVFGKDPVTGCTPAPVTKLTGAKFLTNRPTLPASAAACGMPNPVVVPLKKNGKKPGKKKIMMAAITDGGHPKKDVDKFKLVCMPPAGGPVPGNRDFTVAYNAQNPNGSHFFTSYVNGASVDSDFGGVLHLTAGTPGADGVASLTIAQDSFIHFKDIGGGAECIKFLAAPSQGKLDCDGGTAVGTVQTQMVEAVTCAGVLGIPGGCPGGLPNSAEDCQVPGMVDYSKAFIFDMMAITTGSATATVENPRQNNPATITRTGQPFDCSAFTGSGGPGVLLAPFILSDVSFGGQTFDTANLMQITE